MRVAVPSALFGGLQAQISLDAARCEAYTMVDVEDDQVTGIEVLPNMRHLYDGCTTPGCMLRQAGAQVVVTSSRGTHPLTGTDLDGIEVYVQRDAGTVAGAVQALTDGRAMPLLSR